MLEKNLNFLYFDAHFHYSDCKNKESYNSSELITGCSTAFSENEFINQQKEKKLIQAFGIHPFQVSNTDVNHNVNFLENLLKKNLIQAIGETGFDFYTPQLKETSKLQENYFNIQLELALQYNLPLIIHCRKANEKLFEYSSKLHLLPSVLFHSFMGNSNEAKQLLKHGINGYFSFGKQVFNNNKKVIENVINLPMEKLLLETDAPYQSLKNEDKTYTSEIIKIYQEAFNLRQNNLSGNKKSYEDFCSQIKQNFHSLYKV